MIHKHTGKTGEIAAVDDKGNRYTIIKYTEFFTRTLLDGSTETVEGHNIYRLPNGEYINEVSDSEFIVVISQITLRPVS